MQQREKPERLGLSGPDAYNWPVKVKKRVICNLNTDIVLQFKKSSGKEFHTLTERLTINERQGLEYKRSTDNLKFIQQTNLIMNHNIVCCKAFSDWSSCNTKGRLDLR